MTVSFDIFDTCLIRKCGDAENVFWLLGCKLYGNDSTLAQMYFHWRSCAEDKAKVKLKKQTVTLSEILDCAPDWLTIDKEILESEELGVEESMLCPIPSTLQLLNRLRDEGCRIVFISDMYLPSHYLEKILERYGFFRDEDRIFVSCEYYATKRQGALFDVVQKQIGERIIAHYGDNKWSDVRIPKQKGIKPVLIETGYSKAEAYYLSETKHKIHSQALSCWIGALRFARLTCKNFRDAGMSADFVVPIWIAYTLGVLHKAETQHLDRLYFLARDGYILHWTAKQFTSIFPHIDLRYLYVSRKSMFLPSITEWTHDSLAPYFGSDFKYADKALVHKYFKQSEDTSPSDIVNKAKEARLRIEGYFEQEGILDDNSTYALVDVGWKGSGRVAFNKILKLKGCKPREMWYWSTFIAYRNSFAGGFYTYQMNIDPPVHLITLVEDFFSTSPELSTIDYAKKDGTWIPVFDKESRIDNADILDMNMHCISMVAEFIKEHSLTDAVLYECMCELSTNVILYHPELLELKVLARMKCFSEKRNTGNHVGLIKYAALIDTLMYIVGKRPSCGWFEGDLAYTYGNHFKWMKVLHDRNKRIIKRIFRL